MTETIQRCLSPLLTRCGVEPRPFFALTSTFLLLDFRGQKYSQSTGVRPREALSPLLCVIGQCLLLSCIAAGVLFLRVDVFFFSLANIGLSMVVIAAAIAVEFNEVVFDARDLEAIAPRPVLPRTYSAARFANLLFYVGAMWLALSLFPLILGSAQYDAGPWYAPAYLAASLAGDVLVACGVILVLAAVGNSPRLERWKDILAWVQAALLLIVGYGAQLMFRNRDYTLQLFAAFPPEWINWLPPTWLAWFVESAAVAPRPRLLGIGAALGAVTLLAIFATVGRLSALYAGVQPIVSSRRSATVRMRAVGGLSGRIAAFVCRNRAERAGFWLCRTMLARDAGLRMRCLYALNTVLAVVILGLATGQFADPVAVPGSTLALLPVLAVYLTCLAVPVAVYNLTFVRDSDAAWLLLTSPTEPPEGVARGVCKGVQVCVMTPVCLVLLIAEVWAWQSPLSALLHAGLAWALCWPMALAALWVAVPALPLTRDPARGGSIGPIAIPMAAFSAVAMTIGGLHYQWAGQVWFWCGAFAVCGASVWWLGRCADRRLRLLWEGGG
jgi:hypothetical protein